MWKYEKRDAKTEVWNLQINKNVWAYIVLRSLAKGENEVYYEWHKHGTLGRNYILFSNKEKEAMKFVKEQKIIIENKLR